MYFESVDKVLWRHDRLLKEIWKTYADQHMQHGRASFLVDAFVKFLQACTIMVGSDGRIAARRAFVLGRTRFVDNIDARFKELTSQAPRGRRRGFGAFQHVRRRKNHPSERPRLRSRSD